MDNNTILKIKNENYTFIKEYKDKIEYRNSLNRLAREIYGFDFESWYRLGFWGDRYRPYSLVHNGNIVANISANPLDFQSEGQIYHILQLGTVMTDTAYRGRGLSRTLMEVLLSEYEKDFDLIYLYANDTVLNFYPRFGFLKEEESNYEAYFQLTEKKYNFHKMNLQDGKEYERMVRLASHACPNYRYAMLDNPGLTMFYLGSFLAENVYYCEELSLAVVVEYEGDTLKLMDVFCEKQFDLKEVINSLLIAPKMKICLGFTPLDTEGFDCVPLRETDTTFFTLGKNVLKQGRFPELSHA